MPRKTRDVEAELDGDAGTSMRPRLDAAENVDFEVLSAAAYAALQ